MKLSMDCNFPVSSDRKQHPVPLQFVQAATSVFDHLMQQLMGYGLDQHVELIRIRFLRGGFMLFTVVTSIRLFDFNADSRHEIEGEYGVDALMAANDYALQEIATDLRKKTVDKIGQTLSLCKRRKVRFTDRHEVIEFNN